MSTSFQAVDTWTCTELVIGAESLSCGVDEIHVEEAHSCGVDAVTLDVKKMRLFHLTPLTARLRKFSSLNNASTYDSIVQHLQLYPHRIKEGI